MEKKEGQYVTTTAGCTLLKKPVFAHNSKLVSKTMENLEK